MRFAERLKELRTEKGLTQRALASELNVSPNCICEWEKGRSEPGIESLKILALRLECTLDYLLGFSDDLGNVFIESFRLSEEDAEILREMKRLPYSLQQRAKLYLKKLLEIYDLEK